MGMSLSKFLLTPLREGRLICAIVVRDGLPDFYSRPCGRGDTYRQLCGGRVIDFYSRPCGRGDIVDFVTPRMTAISTHAPAGGATRPTQTQVSNTSCPFLLTPLREGRPARGEFLRRRAHFYSRPCGRGDDLRPVFFRRAKYFYSRPCGRGDRTAMRPCRTGLYFYSRPCGRGDHTTATALAMKNIISTHAPAGGATYSKC